MLVIKYIVLFCIFGTTSYIGILVGNKYSKRVKELQEMKNALSMFESKIKFTYEPLPQVFEEISNKFCSNVGDIFKKAAYKMKEKTADISWSEAISEVNSNMKKEDIDVLNSMSKMLGNTQIDIAQKEKIKNEKLHRTLRYSNWTCNYYCFSLVAKTYKKYKREGATK